MQVQQAWIKDCNTIDSPKLDVTKCGEASVKTCEWSLARKTSMPFYRNLFALNLLCIKQHDLAKADKDWPSGHHDPAVLYGLALPGPGHGFAKTCQQ